MAGLPVSGVTEHEPRAMIQLDRVFKFYKTEGHLKIVPDHISAVFQSGRSYGLLGRVSWPLDFAGGFHGLMLGSRW
jgi:capsular polysaccharide transport system ATP-binding protein